ncbi:hypothetical protein LP419_28175 [Massilia sp. H-1]|nr:hypothetical protein LP419_28175 [Massilia sp. H-1]
MLARTCGRGPDGDRGGRDDVRAASARIFRRTRATSRAPTRIANLRDKLESLENVLSIDRVIVEHFNAHFAAMPPEEFTGRVLVEGLHVKWLMVGDDFCYGARRA